MGVLLILCQCTETSKRRGFKMDDYIKKSLEEMFAYHINLILVDKIDGKKLYTSDSLKKNFILSIEQTGRTSGIFQQIEELVNKGVIVPCFKHKGFFNNLRFQFFGSKDDKIVAGFFYPETKKVYIMIDNSLNKFGFTSNDILASTTVHECIHLFSNANKAKFMSIFMSDLRKFYYEVFNGIFKLKSVPKNLDNVIKYISKFETAKNFNINKTLTEYYNLLKVSFKDISKMEENDFMRTLTNYIVPIKIYFMSFPAFMSSYKKYESIFIPIAQAYQKAFSGKNTCTMEFQELISTSEPICVLSEIKPKNSKIKQVFKKFT